MNKSVARRKMDRWRRAHWVLNRVHRVAIYGWKKSHLGIFISLSIYAYAIADVAYAAAEKAFEEERVRYRKETWQLYGKLT